jgi:hypothetical protein
MSSGMEAWLTDRGEMSRTVELWRTGEGVGGVGGGGDVENGGGVTTDRGRKGRGSESKGWLAGEWSRRGGRRGREWQWTTRGWTPRDLRTVCECSIRNWRERFWNSPMKSKPKMTPILSASLSCNLTSSHPMCTPRVSQTLVLCVPRLNPVLCLASGHILFPHPRSHPPTHPFTPFQNSTSFPWPHTLSLSPALTQHPQP